MRTAASNVKSQAVFVQKLLWFIISFIWTDTYTHNSYRTKFVMVYHMQLNEKRENIAVIVQELLWFIVSINVMCSRVYQVIVQELLWFIQIL